MPLLVDPRDQSAERFLRLVQAKRRGTRKVYLGLAAGVGKTCRLVQETQDLHRQRSGERGPDRGRVPRPAGGRQNLRPGQGALRAGPFFQAENVLQLRRLAVREVAQLLSRQVETGAGGAPAVPAARRNDDRLLACINSNDKAAKEIIRKTSRLADRFSAAAWYVLYIQTGRETSDRIGLATQRHLLNNLQLATELGAQILRVKDDDIVGAIRRVAREKETTLLVCGITSEKGLWSQVSRRGVTSDLLRAVAQGERDLDVYLVTY